MLRVKGDIVNRLWFLLLMRHALLSLNLKRYIPTQTRDLSLPYPSHTYPIRLGCFCHLCFKCYTSLCIFSLRFSVLRMCVRERKKKWFQVQVYHLPLQLVTPRNLHSASQKSKTNNSLACTPPRQHSLCTREQLPPGVLLTRIALLHWRLNPPDTTGLKLYISRQSREVLREPLVSESGGAPNYWRLSTTRLVIARGSNLSQ